MDQLHTPERLEGEGFDAYKARRVLSKQAVKKMMAGERIDHIGHNRRPAIKAAGGIRQWKRARSAAKRSAA